MIAGRFFQGFIVDPHIVLVINDVQIRSTDILSKFSVVGTYSVA